MLWMPRSSTSLLDLLKETLIELRRTVLPGWLDAAILGALSPFGLLYLYFCVPDSALYGGNWMIWICPDTAKIHYQAKGFPLVFFHVAAVGYWVTGLFLASNRSQEITAGREYASTALLRGSAAVLLFLIPVLFSGLALAVPFRDITGNLTVVFSGGPDIRLCACAFRKILPLSRFFTVASVVLGILSFAVRPSRQAAVVSAIGVAVLGIIQGMLMWINR